MDVFPSASRGADSWAFKTEVQIAILRSPMSLLGGGDLPMLRPARWANCAFAIAISDLRSELICLDSPGGQFTVVTDRPIL